MTDDVRTFDISGRDFRAIDGDTVFRGGEGSPRSVSDSGPYHDVPETPGGFLDVERAYQGA